MKEDSVLIDNLQYLHTTPLSAQRIRRNLSLDTEDVLGWCRNKILSPHATITRAGKNWYVDVDDCVLTVNASQYTLITAHKKGPKSVRRTEAVELTVLCLIHRGEEYLLQDRVKRDWQGYTLPGGHVEPGESIVDAVIREMKEETGLTIRNPTLCGIKQFPIEGGRYLVFLFRAHQFEGEVTSSEEGQMRWIRKDSLSEVQLVGDFEDLLRVILDDGLTEFQYLTENDEWNVILK